MLQLGVAYPQQSPQTNKKTHSNHHNTFTEMVVSDSNEEEAALICVSHHSKLLLVMLKEQKKDFLSFPAPLFLIKRQHDSSWVSILLSDGFN